MGQYLKQNTKQKARHTTTRTFAQTRSVSFLGSRRLTAKYTGPPASRPFTEPPRETPGSASPAGRGGGGCGGRRWAVPVVEVSPRAPGPVSGWTASLVVSGTELPRATPSLPRPPSASAEGAAVLGRAASTSWESSRRPLRAGVRQWQKLRRGVPLATGGASGSAAALPPGPGEAAPSPSERREELAERPQEGAPSRGASWEL